MEYFSRPDVAFFIYLISAYAETNRTPFDLPEAESELVAGYHTEYSAMKFAMFFMAEYANMVTVACLATLLFLGRVERADFRSADLLQAVLPVIWFCLKVFFFMFLYVWVRWTLPRFRYDQLMAFGWKVLVAGGNCKYRSHRVDRGVESLNSSRSSVSSRVQQGILRTED